MTVQVSTKSYTENNIKPPSAYRHRQAVLEMLADTGSQAVITGTNQLGQLGLTVRDLMDCEMSGVTNSSVLGYNKYRIRVDGSGRVTDRNRQFLRLFSAVRAGTLIPLSSLTASTALCELECELCRDIAEKVDTRRKLKMYAQVLIILEEENAKLKYV